MCEPAVWRIACSLVIIMAISGPWHGQAEAEEPTPIAGEEFRTTLFGEEIYVPPRDRRSVTAVSFGIQAIPNGPSSTRGPARSEPYTFGEIGMMITDGSAGPFPGW